MDKPNFAGGVCSDIRGGAGWWFDYCSDSNLNGLNLGSGNGNITGILWNTFTGDSNSLKSVTMSVRPKAFKKLQCNLA